MKKIPLKIKQLHPNAKVPVYAHDTDAGADLHSLERIIIGAGETAMIRTGLSVELPPGWEWQIRPRSGFSFKNKVLVINSPGTVDAGYRGEVCILMFNASKGTVKIGEGERIAQAVVQEITQAEFEIVSELSDSERGEGGFGSTGEKELKETRQKQEGKLAHKVGLAGELPDDHPYKDTPPIVDGEDEPTALANSAAVEMCVECGATFEHGSCDCIDTDDEDVLLEGNAVSVFDPDGIAQGTVDIDTSEVTDNSEIMKSVVEIDLIGTAIEELSDNDEFRAFVDANKSINVIEEVTETFEELKSSTPEGLEITVAMIVAAFLSKSCFDKVAEDVEEDLDEDYKKFSPMVDQAIESFCKTEEGKAQYDLAVEAKGDGVDDIKAKVILKIVENQIAGTKTVVVAELKKVLDGIVTID